MQITFISSRFVLSPFICSCFLDLLQRYLGGHDLGINLAVKTRFSEERARFYTAELVSYTIFLLTNLAKSPFTSSSHLSR